MKTDNFFSNKRRVRNHNNHKMTLQNPLIINGHSSSSLSCGFCFNKWIKHEKFFYSRKKKVLQLKRETHKRNSCSRMRDQDFGEFSSKTSFFFFFVFMSIIFIDFYYFARLSNKIRSIFLYVSKRNTSKGSGYYFCFSRKSSFVVDWKVSVTIFYIFMTFTVFSL